MRSARVLLAMLVFAGTAQASPLTPGRPAGIQKAQVSSSFMVFSGVALAAAGAGYLFSSSLGGSTDSTILAINGGQATTNPPGGGAATTTGTP